MADPLAWIDQELDQLKSSSLLRQRTVRSGRQGSRINFNGRQLLNFGSNDYLGFAGQLLDVTDRSNSPDSEVDSEAVGWGSIGWGSGASPLVTGRSKQHAELESQLADFERAESAILFPSGFAANMGTVPALVGRGDIILSDAKNHASLIDGCRLSGARIQVYPHRDIDYLRMMLPQAAGFRRRLIVTDSVFSMDGDLAPLADLVDLAGQHQAMLMVDEAHATGVFGPTGRGLCEEVGVEKQVPVRVGTLSKAMGSMGGFVAGSDSLILWLANRARSYVFSTAAPDVLAAAAATAIRRVDTDPSRGGQLLRSADSLRDRLRDQGWDTGDSASQIIPLYIGDPAQTMQSAAKLLDSGLLLPGIRPPTVPEGESMLRISLTLNHSEDDMEKLLQALASL